MRVGQHGRRDGGVAWRRPAAAAAPGGGPGGPTAVVGAAGGDAPRAASRHRPAARARALDGGGLSCAPAGGPDPWAAGPGGEAAWPGWSAETLAAHAPPALRGRMRDLRARVGPAVLARGLLVPHPHGEFDVLESRVLEALGLQSDEDDDAAGVLPCGHFDDGVYHYDDGDWEASEDGGNDGGADGYAAADAPPSEPPPLIVDDGFDDDTSSSGRGSLSGKTTALLPLTSSPAAPRTSSMLPSVPCAPPPPAARTCPTCANHSGMHPAGRSGGTAGWELTFYAANGLMRAGAWRAAWREMERVDVEIAPRVPSPLRAKLDEAEAVLRTDRARREEDGARAEREERDGERERRWAREREELARGFQGRVDRAAARALELEGEVGALRDERARWLDVLAAQQRQFRPHPSGRWRTSAASRVATSAAGGRSRRGGRRRGRGAGGRDSSPPRRAPPPPGAGAALRPRPRPPPRDLPNRPRLRPRTAPPSPPAAPPAAPLAGPRPPRRRRRRYRWRRCCATTRASWRATGATGAPRSPRWRRPSARCCCCGGRSAAARAGRRRGSGRWPLVEEEEEGWLPAPASRPRWSPPCRLLRALRPGRLNGS